MPGKCVLSDADADGDNHSSTSDESTILKLRARLRADLAAHDAGSLILSELQHRWRGEYNSHRAMLGRRKTHGARVDEEFWRFPNFLRQVGPKPHPSYSLDRIDHGDPEYAPGKVRWASKRTQTQNRSNSVLLTSSQTGETLAASEWARRTRTPLDTLLKRKQRGWTDDQAISGQGPAASRANQQHAQQQRDLMTDAERFATMNGDQLAAYEPWYDLGVSPDLQQILRESYAVRRNTELFQVQWAALELERVAKGALRKAQQRFEEDAPEEELDELYLDAERWRAIADRANSLGAAWAARAGQLSSRKKIGF